MSLDSILRATGKNLANCGEKADWYSPISDLTNLTVSDGVVSLPAVSAGSGMAINKNRVFTNGETFTIHANHTSPTGDVPANQYRYIIKPYKNNTVVKDITIAGWTYNQYYNAYWSSGTSKSFTLPKDTVNSFEWGLGFLAYGDISAGTLLTYSNIQIEKGSTATTYEPYEYLGPKTINLGSGSSSKEVLKVSYNSRNFFDINTLASSVGITKSITNNTITFTSTAVNGRYVYKIPTEIGKQYTVSVKSLASVPTSGQSATGSDIFLGSTANPDTGDYGSITSTSLTKTFTATTKFLYIKQYVCYGANQVGGQKIIEELQVELGNKKTEYVPYFNTVVWTQVLTGYNITSTINADGTQSLNIVDATSTTDHYNITSTDNSDGTQTLNITDA